MRKNTLSKVITGISRVILGTGKTEDDIAHTTRTIRDFQRDEGRTEIRHSSTDARRMGNDEQRRLAMVVSMPKGCSFYGGLIVIAVL